MKTITDLKSLYCEHLNDIKSSQVTDTHLVNIYKQFFPDGTDMVAEDKELVILLNLVTKPGKPYLISKDRLALIRDIDNESNKLNNGFSYLIEKDPTMLKVSFSSEKETDSDYVKTFKAVMIVAAAIAGEERRLYLNDIKDILNRNAKQKEVFMVVLEELLVNADMYIINEDDSYKHEALMAILDYLAIYNLIFGNKATNTLLKTLELDLLPKHIDINELYNFKSEAKYLTDYSYAIRRYKFPFETAGEIFSTNVCYGHTAKNLTANGRIETALALLDLFTDKDSGATALSTLYYEILTETGVNQKFLELADDDELNEISTSLIDAVPAIPKNDKGVVNTICRYGFNLSFIELSEEVAKGNLDYENWLEELLYPTNESEFMELTALTFIKYNSGK